MNQPNERKHAHTYVRRYRLVECKYTTQRRLDPPGRNFTSCTYSRCSSAHEACSSAEAASNLDVPFIHVRDTTLTIEQRAQAKPSQCVMHACVSTTPPTSHRLWPQQRCERSVSELENTLGVTLRSLSAGEQCDARLMLRLLPWLGRWFAAYVGFAGHVRVMCCCLLLVVLQSLAKVGFC